MHTYENIKSEDFGKAGIRPKDIYLYIKDNLQKNIYPKYFNEDLDDFNYFGKDAEKYEKAVNDWIVEQHLAEIKNDIEILFESCRIATNHMLLSALDRFPDNGKSRFNILYNELEDNFLESYQKVAESLVTQMNTELEKINLIWDQFFKSLNNLAFQYKLRQHTYKTLYSYKEGKNG